MSKVPVIFEEYFKTATHKLCHDIKTQTERLVNSIPDFQEPEQLRSQIEEFNQLFDKTKKEFEINFQLLFDMTHPAPNPNLKSKRKKKNKNRSKPH